MGYDISGHAGFAHLAFCAFFMVGEGYTDRIGSGWGQTRFSFPLYLYVCIVIFGRTNMKAPGVKRKLPHSQAFLPNVILNGKSSKLNRFGTCDHCLGQFNVLVRHLESRKCMFSSGKCPVNIYTLYV